MALRAPARAPALVRVPARAGAAHPRVEAAPRPPAQRAVVARPHQAAAADPRLPVAVAAALHPVAGVAGAAAPVAGGCGYPRHRVRAPRRGRVTPAARSPQPVALPLTPLR